MTTACRICPAFWSVCSRSVLLRKRARCRRQGASDPQPEIDCGRPPSSPCRCARGGPEEMAEFSWSTLADIAHSVLDRDGRRSCSRRRDAAGRSSADAAVFALPMGCLVIAMAFLSGSAHSLKESRGGRFSLFCWLSGLHGSWRAATSRRAFWSAGGTTCSGAPAAGMRRWLRRCA